MISDGSNPLLVKISWKLCKALLIVRSLIAKALNESGNVLGPPNCCAGSEFDGFGITPGAATFPPRTAPDGNEGQHLIDTQ
jgi:hypothetical protein